MTFEERCRLSEQCLPEKPYREMLTKLHDEMLEALAQPQQEPLEYWNAVEGWVKLEEAREHLDSVGCGTIYKTAGEGRVPLCIAHPQQEPVAFYVYKPALPRRNLGAVANGDLPWVYDQDPSSGYSARMLVHPALPRRTWVGLTDEEIDFLMPYCQNEFDLAEFREFARAIEAAHGIKENT